MTLRSICDNYHTLSFNCVNCCLKNIYGRKPNAWVNEAKYEVRHKDTFVPGIEFDRHYITCEACSFDKNNIYEYSDTTRGKNITKQSIPLALKRNVWNKHIGENIGKHLCLCCKLTDITQMNFSCGHIISEHNGGELKLNNLKPICVSCNSSMGTKNMDEFMLEYGL